MKSSVIFFVLIGPLTSCYSLRQAYFHTRLFMGREKIDSVVAQNKLPPEEQSKLQEVNKIRSFAAKNGLNVGSAYSRYIRTPFDDAVSFLVYAAEPLDIKAKNHWFLFVGSVPYIGFYDRAERDAFAENYVREGYDVFKSAASAFSSLGWYEDPIYDVMLRKRSTASLAHLLFHELVHRTFWIKGSTEVNENLAEFCADVMTDLYLKDQPEALSKHLSNREDQILFKRWARSLKEDLKALYKTDMTDKEKLKKKNQIFSDYQNEKVPNFKNKNFKSLVQDSEWNNARVIATMLYEPETEKFARAYQCGDRENKRPFENIGDYLGHLEKYMQKHKDIDQAIEAICS